MEENSPSTTEVAFVSEGVGMGLGCVEAVKNSSASDGGWKGGVTQRPLEPGGYQGLLRG